MPPLPSQSPDSSPPSASSPLSPEKRTGGIARKSLLDFSSRIAILFITTLTGIVLNRLVGAAGRGAYVLATAVFFAQMQNFVSLGLQVSHQVLLGADPKRLGQLHAWTVVLAFGVEAMAGLAVWVFREPLLDSVFRGIHPLHLAWITALAGPVFYWSAWQGIMVGVGDIRRFAIFNTMLSLAQNGVIVIVLAIARPLQHPGRLDFTLHCLVGIFALITSLSVIPMVLCLRPHGRLWGALDFTSLKQLFSFGIRVYVGNVASGLLTQLDQLLVNGLAGLSALGVYNQAASLAQKAWMIPAGVESAAYRPMTSSATLAEARLLAVRLFRTVLFLSIGLIAAGWLLAPLIPIIYGRDFRETVLPFRILILGTAFFGCGRMFSIYFTGYRKRPQLLLALNWILLPIQANLCLWLIPLWGLKGACISASASYTLSMLILWTLFQRDGPYVPLRLFFIPQPEEIRRLRDGLARLRRK